MNDRGGEPRVHSSVDNALRLLLLLHSHDELRLTEMASLLDVSPSTAHRLVRSLQRHGFAEQDSASKVYRAGHALSAADPILRRALLREGAKTLHAIAATTGETSHLAVLEGRQVRYLRAVEGSRVVRVSSRVGEVLPAHCSSVGKAMLAHHNDADLRRLYPATATLESRTPASIATYEELMREVCRVRDDGYAYNDAESESGVAAVAAAVVVEQRAIAAVSCAMPTDRMTDQVLTSTVTTVTTLARELGEAISRSWTSS
jgi:DNA-binding IclR family transcriptional regulator